MSSVDLISLVNYKLPGPQNFVMDPQIFQEGVQRTPKFVVTKRREDVQPA